MSTAFIKLDNKGFNKLSKHLVNSLKFTEPQKNGNKPLTINDNIRRTQTAIAGKMAVHKN